MYRDFTVQILKFPWYAEIFSPVLLKLFKNSRMGQKCQEISMEAKSKMSKKIFWNLNAWFMQENEILDEPRIFEITKGFSDIFVLKSKI